MTKFGTPVRMNINPLHEVSHQWDIFNCFNFDREIMILKFSVKIFLAG